MLWLTGENLLTMSWSLGFAEHATLRMKDLGILSEQDWCTTVEYNSPTKLQEFQLAILPLERISATACLYPGLWTHRICTPSRIEIWQLENPIILSIYQQFSDSIFMYIYMCTYMYIYIYMYMYFFYVYIYINICTYMYTYIYICMYTYSKHMNYIVYIVFIFAYIYILQIVSITWIIHLHCNVYIHIYVDIEIYIYIHICTYTYTLQYICVYIYNDFIYMIYIIQIM